MPDLAPFRGLRYSAGPDLTLQTSPPYDVIDAGERDALLANHANNAVRLILPEAADGDRYATAAATLAAWRAEGTLVADARPRLYSYRMEAPLRGGGTHTTVGVIGALALGSRSNGRDVLPHERTLPKAKSDRLALLRATRANFDPIWGLTLATGLTGLVDDVGPVASALDEDGVRHELGMIDDRERLDAIRAVVGSAPVVLADGHHRYETACAYRSESATPGSDAILALVVELDDAQLDVRPFHRLVLGAPSDLAERLGRVWSVRDLGPVSTANVARLVEAMQASDGLGLIEPGRAALLAPTAEQAAKVAKLPPALRDVDAARFDAAIRPLLDGATLAYRNDASSVAAAVAEGDADAAILLRGVSVAQIRAAADAGVLMPEKTTYFAPKPRTGMVMRSLDDC